MTKKSFSRCKLVSPFLELEYFEWSKRIRKSFLRQHLYVFSRTPAPRIRGRIWAYMKRENVYLLFEYVCVKHYLITTSKFPGVIQGKYPLENLKLAIPRMTNSSSNDSIATECLVPLGHGVAMIILNVISSIFGSIGNSLVCATIYTTTGLQTVSNFFLVSLAVADLIVTAIAQPFLVAFLVGGLGGWCFEVVEMIFRLASNVMTSASVIHLCFISVDRCLMVMKPHTFSKILTKSKCRLMLVVSWVFATVYGVLRLTVSKKVTSLFTVFMMAICYVFITTSYLLILYHIRSQQNLLHKRTSLNHGKPASTLRRKRSEVERRVTMTIGIVIIIFTITWLPIIFLRSIRASSNSGTAYNWARTFSLCNSAVNPWIYCYRIPQFRAAYKRILILCQWGKVKGNGVGDTTIGSESGTHPAIRIRESQQPSSKVSSTTPPPPLASDHGKIRGSQENVVETSDEELENAEIIIEE